MDKDTQENKLCEAEVRKNLILAETGQALTLPLATLNYSCEFTKQWNRIQEIWHGKKMICINCGKESHAKRRRTFCSKECSDAYYKTPEAKAKRRAYYQRPEVKARQIKARRVYHQRPEVKAKERVYQQKPEVKARQRAYNQRPESKTRQKAYYQKIKAQRKHL